MADYIEPTKAEFNNAESVAVDTVSTQFPEIQTKAGSVVRELVLRPLAYLYAWCASNLVNLRRLYSVAYLKTSQSTDNEIADQVASNWFITRKQGDTAKGVVTVTATISTVQIAAGALFTVGGIEMRTEYRVISEVGRASYGLEGDTLYVPAVAFDTQWLVNVPVIASESGAIEIEPGVLVEIGFQDSTIVDAQLTSAVTGGSDTETDAQMMARAESNTAEAGIGSWHGYKRKLDYAPVAVLGLGLVAGDSSPMRRARYNTVNLSTGGYVDCYVKTQIQPSVGSLTLTSEYNAGVHTVTIDATNCRNMEGFYAVTRVIVDGALVSDYSVAFGGPDGDPVDYRLSTKQTATVTFRCEATEAVATTIYISYMPGLADLQSYMDYADNKFVGQDAVVKAAVPAQLSLACAAASSEAITDDMLSLLKKTIADTVNSLEVGTRAVNFSDIRIACQNALPDIDLRLPCTMVANVYKIDGSVEQYYSDTGILALSDGTSQGAWDADVCFFSLIQNNIRIDII